MKQQEITGLSYISAGNGLLELIAYFCLASSVVVGRSRVLAVVLGMILGVFV